MLRYLWAFVALAALASCDNSSRDPRARCYGPGKVYRAGDTFQNDCNTCTCNEDGSITCTEMGCGPTCTHEGQGYNAGDSFPAGDGCNLCTCMSSGAVSCTEAVCGKSCMYDNQEYEPGETFTATDGCNTCTCYTDGSVGCTEIDCNCNPATEWWRHYESMVESECALLDFMCPPNTVRFDNPCGCGCEQDASCQQTYDCTPPNMCDIPMIQADCPYSEILQ
jgi:hypothetical protein